MKLTKKVISGMLSASLSVTLLTGIPYNVNNNGIKAKAESVAQTDTGYEEAICINVEYHTQEEIRNYALNSSVSLNDKLEFSEEPVTQSPYSLGKLSDNTLQSALKMLNQIRYIAGISDNVELSDEYNTLCQAAAVANYANDSLSHFPERPDGMSDELYNLATEGAGSSNIAWASWPGRSLNSTIVSSWMEDGDSSNIDRVGHRRWLINPSMGKTGFGAASGENGTYSTVYSFDRSNRPATEYGVAWPAQNMPVEYFGRNFPWSVSMGYTVNEASVNVTLTRKSDNKTWNFQSSSADGSFYVNNDGYGQKGCIIFRPDNGITYNAGDVFKVEITGLDNPVSYTVSFFELNPPAETPEPIVTPSPTPAQTPVITPSPEVTQKPAESVSPSPEDTQTPTVSPSPTANPVQTPTASPFPTASPVQTPTASPSPAVTPAQTPTASPSPTASPVQTPTASPFPTVTPAQTPTVPEASTLPSVNPSTAPSPVITPTVPETSTLPSEKPSTAPSDNPSYVNPAPVTPGIVPEPSIAPVVNINQKVSVGSMAYKVTSVNGAKTVEYTGTKRNINKIIIPASIKINGDNYKVTSIAKNGFKGNKKLSKVTIGANIKKIGKNAFLNCSNLKNIVIKTKKLTAKTVGKNAFKGINKKAIIKVPGSKIRAYSKIIKTKGATGRINIKK